MSEARLDALEQRITRIELRQDQDRSAERMAHVEAVLKLIQASIERIDHAQGRILLALATAGIGGGLAGGLASAAAQLVTP